MWSLMCRSAATVKTESFRDHWQEHSLGFNKVGKKTSLTSNLQGAIAIYSMVSKPVVHNNDGVWGVLSKATTHSWVVSDPGVVVVVGVFWNRKCCRLDMASNVHNFLSLCTHVVVVVDLVY